MGVLPSQEREQVLRGGSGLGSGSGVRGRVSCLPSQEREQVLRGVQLQLGLLGTLERDRVLLRPSVDEVVLPLRLLLAGLDLGRGRARGRGRSRGCGRGSGSGRGRGRGSRVRGSRVRGRP